MTARDQSDGQVLDRAAAIRRLALTPEQRVLRDRVAVRTAAISRGVRPPASGIFGRVKEAKAARGES